VQVVERETPQSSLRTGAFLVGVDVG